MTIPEVSNDTEAEASLVEPLLPPATLEQDEETREVVALLPDDHDDDDDFPNQNSAETLQEQPQEELLYVSIDDSQWEHGEQQEVKCQNSFFALLFVIQVMTVIGFGILGVANWIQLSHDAHTWDPTDQDPIDQNNNHDGENGEAGYYAFALQSLCFILALALSIVLASSAVLTCLLRQTRATKKMIQFSLILSPISFAASAILCLIGGAWPISLLFGFFAIIGACYALRVWHRIPLAAANLAVSMTAIVAHKRGLVSLSYMMTLLTVIWTICWALAVGQISTMDSDQIWDCQNSPGGSPLDDDEDCSLTTGGTFLFIGLLLSFYWTIQVIKNLFHTTVAGVVGTWWFAPSSSPPPQDQEILPQDEELIPIVSESKRVVYDAWIRSSIYSFGSICFGSLVVAVLQVLQYLVRASREERRRNGRHQSASSGLLWCLLQCIVDNLEHLAEYLNKWAFVYVGLYGYDYMTAGSKVFELFQARGWDVIIQDQLVSRVLSLVQLIVALLSGLAGLALGWLFFLRSHQEDFASDMVLLHGFYWTGFVFGIILSDVLFRLVFSAVDTIVVCLAEAPNQLTVLANQNQDSPGSLPPHLANQMISAWRNVYPNECGF